MQGAYVIVVEPNVVGVVLVADVDGVDREVHVSLRVPHEADRRDGVGALVGGVSVEEGEDLCFDGVIDFDHVDGSTGLSRYSRDDEGLAQPRVCHVLGRGAGI